MDFDTAYSANARKVELQVRRHLYSASEADIADITQDVWLKVSQTLNTFDASKSSFETWLHRQVRSLCIDYLRREYNDTTVTYDTRDNGAEELLVDYDNDPESIMSRTQEFGALGDTIEALPIRQRMAMHLKAQGQDYSEIAEALDCTPNAARMLVLRAREQMT